MGCERQPILLLAPDGVLAAKVLRGLDHAAGDRMVLATRGDTCATETVVHAHPRPRRPPSRVESVEGGVAHGLDAASNNDVVGAGSDLHHRLEDCLQTRTAASVHMHPSDGHGKACVEGCNPTDGRRFAGRVAVPKDHVPDGVRLYRASVEKTADGLCCKLCSQQRFEASAVRSDRRPHGFTDYDITHPGSPDDSFGMVT